MPKILVLYSHPNPAQSRLNRVLFETASLMQDVTTHDLYDHYPDFDIDIHKEQQLLMDHEVIIFQHPIYWYSCPSLMKEWIDSVLKIGFAYGENGDKLHGKSWLSSVSTGSDQQAYHHDGAHANAIHQFLLPFERTAHLCGMTFLTPFVSFEATKLENRQIEQQAKNYGNLLQSLIEGES